MLQQSKPRGPSKRRSLRPGPANISSFATTSEEDREMKKAMGPRLTRNILKFIGNWNNLIANPDKIDLKTYDNMFETDETIQSGIEFIVLSALQMLGPYYHSRPRIMKKVQQAITNLKEGWLNFWEELITDGCVYGFGLAESCMSAGSETGKIEDLKTSLDALVGINPRTGLFELDLADNSPTYGDVTAFIQWPESGSKRRIPIEKLVVWSHKSRHGNPYGRSRLKCIWKNWVIKDQMLKGWALAMDRSGSPFTWVSCEDGDKVIVDPDTEEDVIKNVYLREVLDNIQDVNGIIVGKEDKVGQLQVPRSVGADFKLLEDHMNGMMYRGLLIPILLIDTSDVGSNALAQQHFKVYIMSMSKLMQTLVPIVIQTVIRRFIIANFGAQKDYGSFAIKEMAEDSLKTMSDIFYSMTQNGYMSPRNRTDMDHIRRSLTAPALTDEEYAAHIDQMDKELEAQNAPVIDPATGQPKAPPGQTKPGQPGGKSVGGRKGNPQGPEAKKPGTRPAPKPPSTKQGRPKE